MDRRIYDTIDTWGSFSEQSDNTPGINNLKRLGLPLPLHAYEWSRLDGKSPRSSTYLGFFNERSSRGFETLEGAFRNGFLNDHVGGPLEPLTSYSNARQVCLNKLNSKIRNSSVDIGVAFGEYRDTARFISDSMLSVVRSYRRFRRGDVSGALRDLGVPRKGISGVIKGASNKWLSYTYGLKPLLNDVYSSIRALAEGPEVNLIKLERASFGQPIWVSHSYSPADGVLYTNQLSGRFKCVSEVRFEIKNPLLRSLDKLGLLNPASIAWELVPFSFVVDWFVPVGRYIQDIVPPQGVDFVSGWLSLHVQGGAVSITDRSSPGDWHTVASSSEVIKHREVLTTLPRYHVVVPDLSLSASQVTSALALLVQLRK